LVNGEPLLEEVTIRRPARLCPGAERPPEKAHDSPSCKRVRRRIRGDMRWCNQNMEWHRCHRSHFGSRYHIVTCYSQSLFRSDLAAARGTDPISDGAAGQVRSPIGQRDSSDLRSGSGTAPISDLAAGRLRCPIWKRDGSDVRSGSGTDPICPPAFWRQLLRLWNRAHICYL
jgi:hypothetical protein